MILKWGSWLSFLPLDLETFIYTPPFLFFIWKALIKISTNQKILS